MTDTFSGMCHTFVDDTLCFRKDTYLHFILNYIIAVFVYDPEFFILKNSNIFVRLLIFREELDIVATAKKKMN